MDMSIHNAVNRRHRHEERKGREHRHKGRKSLRWGKGRLKKWTRMKRLHNRRERRAVRECLNPITRTFCFVDEGNDSLHFRQIRPRRRKSMRDLSPDRAVAARRTRRKQFRECLLATGYKAAT